MLYCDGCLIPIEQSVGTDIVHSSDVDIVKTRVVLETGEL